MYRWRESLRVGWPVLSALAFAFGAAAAPQTFNTALPVAQGELVLREQVLYRRAGNDPSPAGREVRTLGAISVLGYGVRSDLAVFGVAPYLDKELERGAAGGGRITRRTDGLADMRLFGRYTAFRKDAPGRTLRVALLAGIEAPTGEDDHRDALGILPAALQLGSGSWDPFGGVILTYQRLGYQIDAQVSFETSTAAGSFEPGDEARLDFSFQKRLWPRELGSGVPGFLYGAVEVNWNRRGRDTIAGSENADSGGTAAFLSPGLQYVTKRWVAEAIVQLPVTQDPNGVALEDELTVRAGIRAKF